jgi:GNAT superfamily N-acetyltransferase
LDDLCLETETEEDNNKSPKQEDQQKSYFVGVRYLWVHSEYRRKKIAARLLDSIRSHFLFGQIIESHEIAFTQLTENGFQFAQSYSRSDRIACYQPNLSWIVRG